MRRSLPVALVLLLGCTRYGTNPAGGPFARNRPKADPVAAIPPAPPANNSPLILASATQPAPPSPPDDLRVVPARPEPVALTGGFTAPGSNVTPAGGAAPDPPPQSRRPKPEPQSPLPSPLAPRENPAASPPAPPNPAAQNLADLKRLVQFAAERWAKVDTYEAVLTRRELTPAGKMNDEVVLFQFRKEPMSVFTRNLGENGKGRELVYNPLKYGDKLHVMLGEGDHRLMPAGYKAPPVSPDDTRVTEKSRYSVRTAGWGTPIGRVAEWIARAEASKIPADALTYHGPVNRPEYPYQLVGVSLKLRPGTDPMMPAGGVRQWFFDPKPESPSCGMPVLMTATDTKGNVVEYYLFEKVRLPAGLTDADFNPDRLGKKR